MRERERKRDSACVCMFVAIINDAILTTLTLAMDDAPIRTLQHRFGFLRLRLLSNVNFQLCSFFPSSCNVKFSYRVEGMKGLKGLKG